MAAWIVWVLVAVGLAVGEVLTLAFLLGLLAPAALLAALVAAVGGGAALQILAFILGSLAMLGLVRPIARRHLRTPARLRTGTAALVGQRGLVLERVDADGGQVRIGGEVWTAHAWDERQVIEPGARVEVIEIKGATALVHEWERP
jgi:membrane protein implicated in regulation of membrane protease activity